MPQVARYDARNPPESEILPFRSAQYKELLRRSASAKIDARQCYSTIKTIIITGFLYTWEAIMATSEVKNPAGASDQHTEASVGRIGEDVQRAKENIFGAAAAARGDIAAELNRLSADVINLRDTITALAKTVAVQVGDAGTNVSDDITSSAKEHANALLSEFDAIARRNPLGVVIGAFGIGMLIGMMKGRR